MLMFKSLLALLNLKNAYDHVPATYNFLASNVKLSDNRKAQIEERRGQLKIEASDPQILKIVIQEMLAYKPTAYTLDDRYLQLEQILDAIDKAKVSKQTDELINLCESIADKIALSPGQFKNIFQAHIARINLQIHELKNSTPKAKL